MIQNIDLDRILQLFQTRKAAIAGGVLASWVICRSLNSHLSRTVQNNGVVDKTWNWGKEVVLLTGGSSGIGAAIAARLAQKNVKVIIVDLFPPKKQVARNHFYYELDISSPEDIKRVAQEIRLQHGDPTVLINNAGVGNAKPILEITHAQLRKIFDINIIAHFYLIQEVLPAMIRNNHGHIVALASQASFSTQASNVDYCATKAGVLALHEGLGQELRHIHQADCVRVSVVHPIWVKTPMIQELINKGEFKEEYVEAEDVANAIVDQLYSGNGAQICVPKSYWWTSSIRGMPTWVQEKLRDTVSLTLLKGQSA